VPSDIPRAPSGIPRADPFASPWTRNVIAATPSENSNVERASLSFALAATIDHRWIVIPCATWEGPVSASCVFERPCAPDWSACRERKRSDAEDTSLSLVSRSWDTPETSLCDEVAQWRSRNSVGESSAGDDRCRVFEDDEQWQFSWTSIKKLVLFETEVFSTARRWMILELCWITLGWYVGDWILIRVYVALSNLAICASTLIEGIKIVASKKGTLMGKLLHAP